jgi:chromosome partitioning protein
VSKASAGTSQPVETSTPHAPSPAKPKRASKKQAPVVPETPGHARIIAIANQKGGVGKSTTAVSLGAALADIGYRVLVADLDPQGNASTGMGIRHDAREVTVYDVVVSEADINRAIVPTPVERLHAVPATIDLAGAEIELVSQFSRESRLKKAIEPVSEGVYDFILLDCPPSLGLLTINALTAAEELIVPIQCEYYALEGLGQLLRNVSLVQQNINAGLRLSGIVMTMFDARTKLSEQVVQEVQKYFGDLVYGVIIPRTVRLSEAPGFGQPITVYDAKSKGAEAYRELAREVALRPPPDTPMPHYDEISVAVMAPMDDVVTVEEEGPLPEKDGARTPDQQSSQQDEVAEESSAPPSDVTREVAPELEAVEPEAAPSIESAPRVKAAPARRESKPQLAEEELWEEPPAQPEPRVKPPSSPAPPGELPQRRVVVIDENSEIDIQGAQEVSPPSPGPNEMREGIADIGATLDDEKGHKRRWRMFRKGGD